MKAYEWGQHTISSIAKKVKRSFTKRSAALNTCLLGLQTSALQQYSNHSFNKIKI